MSPTFYYGTWSLMGEFICATKYTFLFYSTNYHCVTGPALRGEKKIFPRYMMNTSPQNHRDPPVCCRDSKKGRQRHLTEAKNKIFWQKLSWAAAHFVRCVLWEAECQTWISASVPIKSAWSSPQGAAGTCTAICLQQGRILGWVM